MLPVSVYSSTSNKNFNGARLVDGEEYRKERKVNERKRKILKSANAVIAEFLEYKISRSNKWKNAVDEPE